MSVYVSLKLTVCPENTGPLEVWRFRVGCTTILRGVLLLVLGFGHVDPKSLALNDPKMVETP